MKTEFKHTPGEWKVVAHNWKDVSVSSEKHICLLSLDEDETTDDIFENLSNERDANAKLIAAAPDLLDALVNMRTAFDLSNEKYTEWIATKEVYDAMSVIDLAIQKAIS
jgi:hypothetical protein